MERYNLCNKVNPFPHTTNLQKTTYIKIIIAKTWKISLSNTVGNIVAKEEIVHYEHFLLLPQCLQKDFCCRGVRKRLYVGKG